MAIKQLKSLSARLKKDGFGKTLGFALGNSSYKIAAKFLKPRLAKQPLEKVITFYSYPDYSDNAKALYDYYLQDEKYKDYRFVWFVREKKRYNDDPRTTFMQGETPYHWDYRLKAQKVLAKAEVVYCTHVPGFKKLNKPGQLVVNLWHGCGYKDSQLKESERDQWFDYALVPGELFVKTKSKFWSCPESKIVTIGYPRYDILLKGSEEVRKYMKSLTKNRTIIWMPTFRKSEQADTPEAKVERKFDLPILDNVEQLKELNDYCKKNKLTIIVKRHPVQKKYSCEDENLSNVLFVSNEDLREHDVDLYAFMHETDALVTDYSSAAIDYLLLDKPIAFALDDFESYKNSRGFVFDDPREYMPGEHLYDFKDFKRFLEAVANNKDNYKAQRAKVRKVTQNPTKNYCERVVKFVETERNKYN